MSLETKSRADTDESKTKAVSKQPIAAIDNPTTASNEAIDRANKTLDALDALQAELELEANSGPTQDELGYRLPSDFLLSIVVPCYNEQATIRDVIASLYALPIPVEVIAVDDGSSDTTCAKLTRLNHEFPDLKVAFQPKNRGKGAALRKGFSLATGSHVMVQDADLEYNPKDIPPLLKPLVNGSADVVYGSRFMEKRWTGSSFVHRMGNRLLTIASNAMTGWRLTDMETCYKIWRRELLEEIELEQNKFGFEVELTSKLARLGARVVERPISYAARGWEEGKKIGWKDAVQALYCILRYR